jgi:DNA-binding transcriptional MerR regulator
MDSVLTIGEVSRRSGVASSALRFYEERGLIASVRAGSGHRRYPRSVLRRIAFIVFAQRIGLALEEIGMELAKLPYSRPQGLGAPFGRMDEADRPEDRRASASQSRANAMHWMRMSFDRQMRVCKSGRSSRAPGTWAALLARLNFPRYRGRNVRCALIGPRPSANTADSRSSCPRLPAAAASPAIPARRRDGACRADRGARCAPARSRPAW